ITGTAVAGSTVTIYRDNDDDGTVSSGDTVVGSQNLAAGVTSYSITVSLVQNSAATPLGVDNDFLVQASNTSQVAAVPTITEDSVAPAAPSAVDLDPA